MKQLYYRYLRSIFIILISHFQQNAKISDSDPGSSECPSLNIFEWIYSFCRLKALAPGHMQRSNSITSFLPDREKNNKSGINNTFSYFSCCIAYIFVVGPRSRRDVPQGHSLENANHYVGVLEIVSGRLSRWVGWTLPGAWVVALLGVYPHKIKCDVG